MFETIQTGIKTAGAISGLLTLALAIYEIFMSLQRPAGREEKGARIALKNPVLIISVILFFTAGALMWRPLPVHFGLYLNAAILGLGVVLFFPGLYLYLWGLKTLGKMFAPSSGFGVRLHADHKLVSSGPFSLLRHPMYLGVIISSSGTLFIYQTWASLCLAIMMFGLIVRARREEKVLAEEFGEEWKNYALRVPAWFPRMGKSLNKNPPREF